MFEIKKTARADIKYGDGFLKQIFDVEQDTPVYEAVILAEDGADSEEICDEGYDIETVNEAIRIVAFMDDVNKHEALLADLISEVEIVIGAAWTQGLATTGSPAAALQHAREAAHEMTKPTQDTN
ncbi:hypothetical protein ACWJJH_14170 [Endozoicomonadaceae bacterium StTr2]